MRFRFGIIRTQTAERVIRATDEHTAMKKLREELDRPYGFFGRWEDAALDVELLGVDPVAETAARSAGEGPLLLSVKDAAVLLGVSRGLRYELLNRGDIESLRIGQRRLINRDALNRFVEANSGTG